MFESMIRPTHGLRQARMRQLARATSRKGLSRDAAALALCASLALLPGCATTGVSAAARAGGCAEAVHEPWPASSDVTGPADELPRARSTPRSAYPMVAKEMRVEGTVTVSALVCEHGRVVRTRVKESIPALDEAAMETVKRWQFKPARAAGKPVSRWVDVPVKFNL